LFSVWRGFRNLVRQGLLIVESRTVDFEKCCDSTAEAATKRYERSLEFDGGGDE